MKYLIILVIAMLLTATFGLLAMSPIFSHENTIILLLSFILARDIVHGVLQEEWWKIYLGDWMEFEDEDEDE